MHPILCSLGPITLFGHEWGPLRFYSYGLMLALGLGVAIYLFAKDAARNLSVKVGLSPETTFQRVIDLGVWVIISSLAGARLFYVLENHEQYRGAWAEVFFLWKGGLVFYGGLFGALVAAYFWLKSQRWPIATFYDLVAPYILLGHVLGRVGCFLNGCCYGTVAPPHEGFLDWGHGWIFPGGEDQEPHLPTQLWEMTGDLTLFSLLLWARRWTLRFPWLGLSLYGLTYGTLRWAIEFWRRDWDKRYLWFFNSASQAISGILVLVSVAVIVWTLTRHRDPISRDIESRR
jgi:phosphatidylglycerol:prolipoprotein diacylglycerol transferase